VCSAFGRLRLEGGGHGDELFCSAKHEECFCSHLNVVFCKVLSCMHLSCVKEYFQAQ